LYEMPAGCASSSCVTKLATGNGPYGVALDGSGNVYFCYPNLNRVKELNRATPPSLTFATPTRDGTTDATDGPMTAHVSNIGNEPLIFTTPSSGGNPSYPANFPENSLDTNLCTSAAPLAAGANCDVSVNFLPSTAGADTGNIVLTDNNLNVTGATQDIAVDGTGTGSPLVMLSTTSLSFASLEVGVASASQSVTLTNTVAVGHRHRAGNCICRDAALG